jgi:hypothetical protein
MHVDSSPRIIKQEYLGTLNENAQVEIKLPDSKCSPQSQVNGCIKRFVPANHSICIEGGS